MLMMRSEMELMCVSLLKLQNSSAADEMFARKIDTSAVNGSNASQFETEMRFPLGLHRRCMCIHLSFSVSK